MGNKQSTEQMAGDFNKAVDNGEDGDVIDRLTEAQLDEFREAFASFDKDGGGSIDAQELKMLMASVGQMPTDEEVSEMIRIADADGSGEVDFYEFVALMAHKMADPANVQAVSEAFKIFDADGSGQISAKELQQIMMNVGEPCTMNDITGVLQTLDKNGDGGIDINEFSAAVLDDVKASQELAQSKAARRRSLVSG